MSQKFENRKRVDYISLIYLTNQGKYIIIITVVDNLAIDQSCCIVCKPMSKLFKRIIQVRYQFKRPHLILNNSLKKVSLLLRFLQFSRLQHIRSK